jgi:hypothetical protein
MLARRRAFPGEQPQVIQAFWLRHGAFHRLRRLSIRSRPYYLGRAAIGRTPKSCNRPIGGINVGQKIVID